MLIHTEQTALPKRPASCGSPCLTPASDKLEYYIEDTIWDFIHKPWCKMNSRKGQQKEVNKPATELWSFGLPLLPTSTLTFRKASVHLLEEQDQFCQSTGPLIDLSSSEEVKRWL